MGFFFSIFNTFLLVLIFDLRRVTNASFFAHYHPAIPDIIGQSIDLSRLVPDGIYSDCAVFSVKFFLLVSVGLFQPTYGQI